MMSINNNNVQKSNNNNRAKMNWSKVRQLLLKNNQHYQHYINTKIKKIKNQ